MYKSKVLIIFLFFTVIYEKATSQISGTGINFQAIARDLYYNPAKDRKIYIKSTILQSSTTGTAVLVEEIGRAHV